MPQATIHQQPLMDVQRSASRSISMLRRCGKGQVQNTSNSQCAHWAGMPGIEQRQAGKQQPAAKPKHGSSSSGTETHGSCQPADPPTACNVRTSRGGMAGRQGCVHRQLAGLSGSCQVLNTTVTSSLACGMSNGINIKGQHAHCSTDCRQAANLPT